MPKVITGPNDEGHQSAAGASFEHDLAEEYGPARDEKKKRGRANADGT